MKFASTPETQAFFSSNTGYYPTRKAAYAVSAVFGTFVKTRSSVQSAMEQFITGKVPMAKQALDTAEKQSSIELAEYNASY